MLQIWFRGKVVEYVRGLSYEGEIGIALPSRPFKKFSVFALCPLCPKEEEFIVWEHRNNRRVCLAELYLTKSRKANGARLFTDVVGRDGSWTPGQFEVIDFLNDLVQDSANQIAKGKCVVEEKTGFPVVQWNQSMEFFRDSEHERSLRELLCS